jgi:hypothetical protein
MQMMADALTVLGSRIGFGWDPGRRKATLIRLGTHPGVPFQMKAGVTYNGKTIVLPLCEEGATFGFVDQGMSTTTMTLSGIDGQSGLQVKLQLRIPFRPRDAAFSTTPVVLFDLEVKRLASDFRWEAQLEGDIAGTLFLGFEAANMQFQANDDGEKITVNYPSRVARPWGLGGPDGEWNNCQDTLAVLEGNWKDGRLEAPFVLGRGKTGPRVSAAWCVYDIPVMNVLGDRCPFKYTQYFSHIDEVSEWAKTYAEEIRLNAMRVDRIMSNHTLGKSVTNLMAQTLHSWLLNTWWVVRPDGQDWFTVWEGICQLNSTLDVEYTQAPFYLAVWPELLDIQLHQWPHFAKDGTKTLGPQGMGTRFLSHDVGRLTECTKDDYPHEMEIEESANYLLLAFAHWKRTGLDTIVRKYQELIKQVMSFIIAADTTGNGIPNIGCANTIDDASSAIQYASEQIYLGVKAMSACKAGIEMLKYTGVSDLEKYTSFVAKASRTIEGQGWLQDHYVVTLTQTMDGLTDPWTGEPKTGELEGWDAYHIYTQNGLALLDMVGFDTGLSPHRLIEDLQTARQHTIEKYGCRHTSYLDAGHESKTVSGLMSSSKRVGWISMNMVRDIAAAYRGVDFLQDADHYWDWQQTVNTQGMYFFHETFYGNHLHFYPRGIAIFGYFDAASGYVLDKVDYKQSFSPVRAPLQVPILMDADWTQGTCTIMESRINKGKIAYHLSQHQS